MTDAAAQPPHPGAAPRASAPGAQPWPHETAAALDRRARAVLWAEFLALFLGIPALMVLVLPPAAMWPVMFAATGLSFLLLHRDGGFSWRGALAPPSATGWLWTAAVAAACLALGAAVVALSAPDALFVLPLKAAGLWATIMLLYPPLSALPQEIIFRTLFFARYARLFPTTAAAVAANGVVFGLAHAFLGNWVAVVLSGLGGAVFALAYLKAGPRRGLWTVTAMHAAAGCALFTAGMGVFLYHGFAGP